MSRIDNGFLLLLLMFVGGIRTTVEYAPLDLMQLPVLESLQNVASPLTLAPTITMSMPPPMIAPSLYPLQYITPQVIGDTILRSGQEAVWSALLPIDQQDAVAIFISEGVSGFLGGVAAKGTELLKHSMN